jgi:hypothetical protein
LKREVAESACAPAVTDETNRNHHAICTASHIAMSPTSPALMLPYALRTLRILQIYLGLTIAAPRLQTSATLQYGAKRVHMGAPDSFTYRRLLSLLWFVFHVAAVAPPVSRGRHRLVALKAGYEYVWTCVDKLMVVGLKVRVECPHGAVWSGWKRRRKRQRRGGIYRRRASRFGDDNGHRVGGDGGASSLKTLASSRAAGRPCLGELISDRGCATHEPSTVTGESKAAC